MISLLHVSTGTETVLRKCIKTIISSGNYEKEGDCFARMRERKLICNWLACIQLLFLPFLCNLIKKSDFIKTKLALKNCEETFLKNIFYEIFKCVKKYDGISTFRTLLLRRTSAIQTHINTTEINYCLLKNRARQITKCLRNDKHALAFEPTLHLGESREVTREPHAKGHAGPKGWGNKRPPPFSRRRRTLARSLAIIGVLAVIIRSMFSPLPVNAIQTKKQPTERKEAKQANKSQSMSYLTSTRTHWALTEVWRNRQSAANLQNVD